MRRVLPLCVCVLGALISVGGRAAAAEPSAEVPVLDTGFSFRLELGWADAWTRRDHSSAALEQKHNADAASLALRLGYAPAHWVALQVFLQDTTARSTYETNGTESKLQASHTMTGVGALFYPVSDSGFYFGASGGVAFVSLEDPADDSMMLGPGFSATLGVDRRISTGDAGAFLLGPALRFDMAPKVKGDDFEGSAYALSFVLATTL